MLVKLVNFLPASMKSINPVQKLLHITEWFACARKMLAIIFLFPTNSLISSGNSNKALQCVPTFMTYVPSFIYIYLLAD